MKSLGKGEEDMKFRFRFFFFAFLHFCIFAFLHFCIFGVHQRDLGTDAEMALGYTYHLSISNRFCYQQQHAYSFIQRRSSYN
jgi:hypothetical protein